MNVGEVAIVLVVGLAAGALNSVAGGGTTITYPTLVFIGLNPIVANATSTLALWPGYVAATAGFRRELVGTKRLLLELALPSLAGGIIGAILLLLTPNHAFELLAPFLILMAAVLLLLQDLRPAEPHADRVAAGDGRAARVAVRRRRVRRVLRGRAGVRPARRATGCSGTATTCSRAG